MNQQRLLTYKFVGIDSIKVDLVYLIFMGNNPDICLCNCQKYFTWQQHENTILLKRYCKQ